MINKLRSAVCWIMLFHHGYDRLNMGFAVVVKAFLSDSARRRSVTLLESQWFRDGEIDEVRFQNWAPGKGTSSDSAASMVPSVTRSHLPCSVKAAWEQIVPELNLLKYTAQNGCDVSVEWIPGDDLMAVSASLVNRTNATAHLVALIDHLAACMEEFETFCSHELLLSTAFRARIVATRGATKCPRWHFDHVPVRWIQSLVGPGCEYLDDYDGFDSWKELKEHLNGDEEDSRKNWSIAHPEQKRVLIRQAEEQEVALLAGNRWNEFAQSPRLFVAPVLHKSPEIPFWKGRVLLTFDVVVPHHND